MSPEVIELITFIAIDQKYPILIGNTLKYFMQNGYHVSPEAFKSLAIFLERSKGFEEDAKRFLYLSSDTEHIQLNYAMVRTFFQRCIKFKKGEDFLQLFEQLRKNLKLNKSFDHTPESERDSKLKTIKKDFYDGVMTDLIQAGAFKLALVIYGEKQREKLTPDVHDRLIGMQIFSAQKNLNEFQEIFDEVMDESNDFRLNTDRCEKICQTLKNFNTDQTSGRMQEMMEKLSDKMIDQDIHMTNVIVDDYVRTYGDSSDWFKVTDFLQRLTPENSSPDPRIVSFLKKNLIYIMDVGLRNKIKDLADEFEKSFFTYEARKNQAELRAARQRQA